MTDDHEECLDSAPLVINYRGCVADRRRLSNELRARNNMNENHRRARASTRGTPHCASCWGAEAVGDAVIRARLREELRRRRPRASQLPASLVTGTYRRRVCKARYSNKILILYDLGTIFWCCFQSFLTPQNKVYPLFWTEELDLSVCPLFRLRFGSSRGREDRHLDKLRPDP